MIVVKHANFAIILQMPCERTTWGLEFGVTNTTVWAGEFMNMYVHKQNHLQYTKVKARFVVWHADQYQWRFVRRGSKCIMVITMECVVLLVVIVMMSWYVIHLFCSVFMCVSVCIFRWQKYGQRNKSEAKDLFCGQLLSQVTNICWDHCSVERDVPCHYIIVTPVASNCAMYLQCRWLAVRVVTVRQPSPLSGICQYRYRWSACVYACVFDCVCIICTHVVQCNSCNLLNCLQAFIQEESLSGKDVFVLGCICADNSHDLKNKSQPNTHIQTNAPLHLHTLKTSTSTKNNNHLSLLYAHQRSRSIQCSKYSLCVYITCIAGIIALLAALRSQERVCVYPGHSPC